MITKIISAIFALLLIFSPANAQSHVDFYKQSIAAYKASDYLQFLNATLKADSARPNHPVILYNLANAYLLNDDPENALKTLDYRTHFYASPDFLGDKDLKKLHDEPGWERLTKNLDQLNKTHVEAEPAFSIKKEEFHPEGLAYYRERGALLISDVRQGIIYTLNLKSEKLHPIIDLKKHGYWSALGLKVDPANPNNLWVTTSAIPNFIAYSEEHEGKSAVLLFDMVTGKLLENYHPETKGHHFGDLLISRTGAVFISDSGPEPFIYRINRITKKTEPFITHTNWWNLQGIAFPENEGYLYVADYITGIYSVHMESKEVKPLIEQNEWLRGSDGIYSNGNRLILLQNGTTPKRVATIQINGQGAGIFESLQFPHKAAEELQEPTLGTWVDGEFYYIGNSPWTFYDEQNNPKSEEWPEVYIYRLKQ